MACSIQKGRRFEFRTALDTQIYTFVYKVYISHNPQFITGNLISPLPFGLECIFQYLKAKPSGLVLGTCPHDLGPIGLLFSLAMSLSLANSVLPDVM